MSINQTLIKVVNIFPLLLIIDKLKRTCNKFARIKPTSKYLFLILFDLKYENAAKIPIMHPVATCKREAPMNLRFPLMIAASAPWFWIELNIKSEFSTATNPRDATIR